MCLFLNNARNFYYYIFEDEVKTPAKTGVKYLNLTEKEAQGQVVIFSTENYAFSFY